VTIDDNRGGTVQSQSISGNYIVESSGRVTLTNLVGGGGNNHPPVFYLVGLNHAFVVGTDNTVTFGMIQPQSGTGFTNASLSGNYLGGSQPPVSFDVSAEADQVNANAGTFAGTSDSNSGGCGGGSGCAHSSTIAATYTVASNGRVLVSQSGTQVGIMYIISTSQVVFLPTSDSSPQLTDFHK
jgi:hypothetical protein